jgi:hypothetical protein
MRELLCMVCNREHPVWAADNDLWNSVLRRPDGSDEYPFLCPTCFMVLAADRGAETSFRVTRLVAHDGARCECGSTTFGMSCPLCHSFVRVPTND